MLFLLTRRDNDSRKPLHYKGLHHSFLPAPHASPVTESITQENGLLLTELAPTVDRRLTWPRSLDGWPRMYSAMFANTLATMKDSVGQNKNKDGGQLSSSSYSRASPTLKKNGSCHQVSSSSSDKCTQPVEVHVLHDSMASKLQMIPDTGVDVTVVSTRHLEMLRLLMSSL